MDQEKLEKALACMQAALALLDDADAPADIGAHLDLAICRLVDRLSQSLNASGINKIRVRRT